MQVLLHKAADKYLNRLSVTDHARINEAIGKLEKEQGEQTMTATALRRELQGYIKTMPERKLEMLKPLLSELAEPLYTIEPASPEEVKMIDRRVREYDKDPSSFVPWKKRTAGAVP